VLLLIVPQISAWLVYRGMTANGAHPQAGPTARQLGVRPDGDVKAKNAADPVKPGEGMSGAQGTPCNLPPHRRPGGAFGGTGKDPVWQIDSAALPNTLAAVKDQGNHVTIGPAAQMTLQDFQAALAATANLWALTPNPNPPCPPVFFFKSKRAGEHPLQP